MNKFSLLATTLLACGGVAHDHAHGDGHEHGHGHGDADAGEGAKARAPEAPAPPNQATAPSSAPLGDLTVNLAIRGKTIEVARGDHTKPTEELRAVVTDSRGSQHRVTLTPTESGWRGEMPSFDADGAVVVLTWTRDTGVATGRLGWGTAATKAAPQDDGHDHETHGHAGQGHGDQGHSHGDQGHSQNDGHSKSSGHDHGH